MESLQKVNFDVFHPQEYCAVVESGVLKNVCGNNLDSDHILSIIREIREFESFAILSLIDFRPKDFNLNHFISLVNLLCVPECEIPPPGRRAFISVVINEWLQSKMDKPVVLLPIEIPDYIVQAFKVNGVKFKHVPRNAKKIVTNDEVADAPTMTIDESQAKYHSGIQIDEPQDLSMKKKPSEIEETVVVDLSVKGSKLKEESKTIFEAPVNDKTENTRAVEDEIKETPPEESDDKVQTSSASEQAPKIAEEQGQKSQPEVRTTVIYSSTNDISNSKDKILREELVEFRKKFPYVYEHLASILLNPAHYVHIPLKRDDTPLFTRAIQCLIDYQASLEAFIMITLIFLNHKVDLSKRNAHNKTAYDYVEEAVKSRKEESSDDAKKLLAILKPDISRSHRSVRSASRTPSVASSESYDDFIKTFELEKLKTLGLTQQMYHNLLSWSQSTKANRMIKGHTPYLTSVIQKMIHAKAPLQAFIVVSEAFLNHNVNISRVDILSKTAYDYVKEMLVSRNKLNSSDGQKLLSILNPTKETTASIKSNEPSPIESITKSSIPIPPESKGDFIKPSELVDLTTLGIPHLSKQIIQWCVNVDVHHLVNGKTPYLTSVINKMICAKAPAKTFVIVSEAFIQHNVDFSLIDGSSKTAYDYVLDMLVVRNELITEEGQKLVSILCPILNAGQLYQRLHWSLILPGFEAFSVKYPLYYIRIRPILKNHLTHPFVFHNCLTTLRSTGTALPEAYMIVFDVMEICSEKGLPLSHRAQRLLMAISFKIKTEKDRIRFVNLLDRHGITYEGFSRMRTNH